MFKPVALLALFVSVFLVVQPPAALAQEGEVYIQVEALPDQPTAVTRAQAYTALFAETNGFGLRSGWFGILLGPYPPGQAAELLASLKAERLIPGDSFIAYPRDMGDRFWPAEGAPATAVADPAEADPPAAEATLAAPEPEPAEAPDEDRQQARDSEALLTPEERRDLQTALQWFGF